MSKCIDSRFRGIRGTFAGWQGRRQGFLSGGRQGLPNVSGVNTINQCHDEFDAKSQSETGLLPFCTLKKDRCTQRAGFHTTCPLPLAEHGGRSAAVRISAMVRWSTYSPAIQFRRTATEHIPAQSTVSDSVSGPSDVMSRPRGGSD